MGMLKPQIPNVTAYMLSPSQPSKLKQSRQQKKKQSVISIVNEAMKGAGQEHWIALHNHHCGRG
eukprot:scaffold85399_cov15-Tisochrysis_lutea.AAC.1